MSKTSSDTRICRRKPSFVFRVIAASLVIAAEGIVAEGIFLIMPAGVSVHEYVSVFWIFVVHAEHGYLDVSAHSLIGVFLFNAT